MESEWMGEGEGREEGERARRRVKGGGGGRGSHTPGGRPSSPHTGTWKT